MLNSFKKRKPWASGLISLILGPTVGMFYLNKGKIGAFYILATILFAAFPFIAAHYGILDFDPITMMDMAVLILHLFGMIHCILIAREYETSQLLKWYAKWHNILGLFILLPYFSVLMFRIFAFEPFHIPSASMSPNINVGDYLFAEKYEYGYSKYSLPLNAPLIDGKIFTSSPERGDVIIYKNPYHPHVDYIKRVIGLPGETIQVIQSRLYINGVMVDREPTGTFVITKNGKQETLPKFLETLPNGVSYDILDTTENGVLDNTPEYHIPQYHYFVLGDNRDSSLDSRVLDQMGYIPEENIIAKASVILWNGNTHKLQSKAIHSQTNLSLSK